MSQSSRFTSSQSNPVSTDINASANVGLVELSDFRKRRTELHESRVREARESLLGNTTTKPDNDTSTTDTPADKKSEKIKKKRKNGGKVVLSFGDEEEEDDLAPVVKKKKKKNVTMDSVVDGDVSKKVTANSSVLAPKIKTKSTLAREAAERDALRREFLSLQESVKNTEIALPFVFYDGTDIPGGVVRVRKGDYSWVFLDKSRKVGADMGVGGVGSRKEWARVGVDDLILVRGGIIVPHHFDFYYFVVNKTLGPNGKRLFEFSDKAPKKTDDDTEGEVAPVKGGLQVKGADDGIAKPVLPDISTLEGFKDDPSQTKVVDRRWYERNKHIYPASTWQEFDPEVDYTRNIKRDQGGNAFFYS